MTTGDPETRAALFGRVIRGLLRPLIRALIAQGVTAPAFYRIVKQVYVEVAEADFPLDGKRPTDSRITLLTGVHRREVRAQRAEAPPDETALRRKVTALSAVLARWLAGPDTVDTEGRPLPLPRNAAEGPSFEALARGISSDIRPRTVLDELRRQGLVEEAGETVILRADAFLGPADLEQRVHFFAANVGDHIAAAVENLLAEEPRFMERAVFYNRLTPASADEVEALARSLGTGALVEVNRLAHRRQKVDMEATDGTERFRFGVFFYREDEGTGSDDPPQEGRDGPATGTERDETG